MEGVGAQTTRLRFDRRLSRTLVAMFVALLSFGPGLAVGPGPAAAVDAPCPDIMRALRDHLSKTGGEPEKLIKLARKLGTSAEWLEHCMHIFGRRPPRGELTRPEQREEMMDAREIDEVEEAVPEDAEEPGARERAVRPARPRYIRDRIVPTPRIWERESSLWDE